MSNFSQWLLFYLFSMTGLLLFSVELYTIAHSTKTRHFQTKARLPIFKLKRIKVPVDQISKLKRLLIQKPHLTFAVRAVHAFEGIKTELIHSNVGLNKIEKNGYRRNLFIKHRFFHTFPFINSEGTKLQRM